MFSCYVKRPRHAYVLQRRLLLPQVPLEHVLQQRHQLLLVDRACALHLGSHDILEVRELVLHVHEVIVVLRVLVLQHLPKAFDLAAQTRLDIHGAIDHLTHRLDHHGLVVDRAAHLLLHLQGVLQLDDTLVQLLDSLTVLSHSLLNGVADQVLLFGR